MEWVYMNPWVKTIPFPTIRHKMWRENFVTEDLKKVLQILSGYKRGYFNIRTSGNNHQSATSDVKRLQKVGISCFRSLSTETEFNIDPLIERVKLTNRSFGLLALRMALLWKDVNLTVWPLLKWVSLGYTSHTICKLKNYNGKLQNNSKEN